MLNINIRFTIASTLILVFNTILTGQSIPFSYSGGEKGNVKIRYEKSLDHDQKYDHLMLKEMATDQVKDLEKVFFRLNYNIIKKIEPLPEDSLRLEVGIDLDIHDGDIFTKGFNLADALMPEYLKVKIILRTQRNKYFSEEFRFDNIPIVRNKARISFHVSPGLSFPDYFLLTDSVSFGFSKTDYEQLIEYHQYVKDFYSSEMLMDSTLKLVDFTREYIPDSLYTYIINLEKAAAINRFIKDHRFDTLHERHVERGILNKHIEKVALYDRYLKMSVFYMDEFITTFKSEPRFFNVKEVADYYIKVSTQFEILNNQASLSNYHFINHFINDYNYTTLPVFYFKWLNKLSLKLKPGVDALNASLRIVDEITRKFIAKGEKYLSQNRHKEAFELLAGVKRFREEFPGPNRSEQVDLLISQALYGMYNSFLTIAERAIQSKNPAMAMLYLEKADYYQRTYREYILSDSKVRNQKHYLLELYVSRGGDENKRKNYSSALSCFEQAEELCAELSEYNYAYELQHGISVAKNGIYQELLENADSCLTDGNISCADYFLGLSESFFSENSLIVSSGYKVKTLKDQIEFKKYSKLIEKGIGYYQKRNFKQAFVTLKRAYESEKRNKYPANDQLRFYLALSTSPFFEQQIDEGLLSVVQDDIEKASDLYYEMLTVTRELGLSLDNSSKTGMQKLNRYIEAKTCQNAEVEFDNMMYKATMLCRQKDYIGAMDYFSLALNISEANKSCKILDTIVFTLRSEFILPADFQIHIQELNDLLLKGDTGKYFSKYVFLDHFYLNNVSSLKNYVDYTNLFSFLNAGKDKGLILFGIQYFISLREPHPAFDLLTLLHDLYYPSWQISGVQKQLGSLISASDQKEFPNRDPRIEVLRYTGGDKWFKDFRNAYVNSWKGDAIFDQVTLKGKKKNFIQRTGE